MELIFTNDRMQYITKKYAASIAIMENFRQEHFIKIKDYVEIQFHLDLDGTRGRSCEKRGFF